MAALTPKAIARIHDLLRAERIKGDFARTAKLLMRKTPEYEQAKKDGRARDWLEGEAQSFDRAPEGFTREDLERDTIRGRNVGNPSPDRAPERPETIAEEYWPDRIYVGGDQDRPWMIHWTAPREDFPTRPYVPESKYETAHLQARDLAIELELMTKSRDGCVETALEELLTWVECHRRTWKTESGEAWAFGQVAAHIRSLEEEASK